MHPNSWWAKDRKNLGRQKDLVEFRGGIQKGVHNKNTLNNILTLKLCFSTNKILNTFLYGNKRLFYSVKISCVILNLCLEKMTVNHSINLYFLSSLAIDNFRSAWFYYSFSQKQTHCVITQRHNIIENLILKFSYSYYHFKYLCLSSMYYNVFVKLWKICLYCILWCMFCLLL